MKQKCVLFQRDPSLVHLKKIKFQSDVIWPLMFEFDNGGLGGRTRNGLMNKAHQSVVAEHNGRVIINDRLWWHGDKKVSKHGFWSHHLTGKLRRCERKKENKQLGKEARIFKQDVEIAQLKKTFKQIGWEQSKQKISNLVEMI